MKEIAGLEKVPEVAKVLGEFGCANFKFREKIAGWREMQQVVGPEGKVWRMMLLRVSGIAIISASARYSVFCVVA